MNVHDCYSKILHRVEDTIHIMNGYECESTDIFMR